MMGVALALAGLALLLAAWSYLFYPVWIARRARRASPSVPEPSPPPAAPSIEVVIAASEEEASIAGRVQNVLEQGMAGLSVRIGCDGCEDSTAERAREAARRLPGGAGRVAVVEFPQKRGKAPVLNDLVAGSKADLVVFTDANTRFDPKAIARLSEPFRDPAVGAVCGRLVFEEGAGRESPESAYWDRETRTKQAEGRLGVCLGANGAIYAARRALVEPLPPGTTAVDDFLIPARIAASGRRVLFEGMAVAREPAAPDVAQEMARRFRLGVGAGRILVREGWLWNFRRHALLTFAFFSRKAARWLAPVFALSAALAALFDARTRLAGGAALGIALVLAAIASARPRISGPSGRLYYFVVINVSLAAGVVAGLAGYRRPAWRRTTR